MSRSVALVVAATAWMSSNCNAQFGNGFFRGVVGGVSIDANGVLRTATEQEQSESLEQLRNQMLGAQGELAKQTDRRFISLKQIQKLVVDASKNNTQLPEEVLFLGGLTRVENVLVFPERQDIVIAGPAEPWTIGNNGSVVGTKSGRPVVYLDDLLCAFQTVMNARSTGISVSIEPTEQGARQLTQALSNMAPGVNPQQFESALAQAFGPQQVKLTGVSPDSHMARVILAADYRMKLYGMNLAQAPVQGLPSYLEMIQNRSNASSQMQSRWWMACDYDSVEHSKDKLAWRITGAGIKTLTEQEQLDGSGKFKQTGKADVLAKKWADLFTKKLGELSVKEPVFGELRNIMDLCVVAALIESQNLQSLAQCDLSQMIGEKSTVALAQCDVPRSLDPQVTFLQTVQGWLVSASGGVMVDSWQIVQTVKLNDKLNSSREAALNWSNTDKWYQ